jgi:hypothetical protein
MAGRDHNLDVASSSERAGDGSEITSLDVAIVNANRDVELALIEDAGKTRRVILWIALPPFVVFAVGTLYLLQRLALALLVIAVG